jgi:hypothetical protein
MEANKMNKLKLVYDDYEVIKNEIDYILNNKTDYLHLKSFDNDYLCDYISQNYDLFQFAYDDFIEELQSIIDKKNKTNYWKVEGINLNWRNSSGYKYINTNNAKDLLSKILPNTDCSISVENYKNGLYIKAKHHDQPVNGSSFYILPCSQKTYYKFN